MQRHRLELDLSNVCALFDNVGVRMDPQVVPAPSKCWIARAGS